MMLSEVLPSYEPETVCDLMSEITPAQCGHISNCSNCFELFWGLYLTALLLG